MELKKGLNGIYVVLPTPFSVKGDFDASAETVFRRIIDKGWLLA